MFYKFIFIFMDRDHEFLIQCLHLLTRHQVLLQEENSTDPEVLKESLQDPQHSEQLSSLMVSDCLRIQDVLSTGQHCCHPGRVKTMKTEQTEMENVVLIFNSSAADKENSIQLQTSLSQDHHVQRCKHQTNATTLKIKVNMYHLNLH